jgi:hypothetical protein
MIKAFKSTSTFVKKERAWVTQKPCFSKTTAGNFFSKKTFNLFVNSKYIPTFAIPKQTVLLHRIKLRE